MKNQKNESNNTQKEASPQSESRRRVLRSAGLALGAGGLGLTLPRSQNGLGALGSFLFEGREAYGLDTTKPTYVIEICLREQWDLQNLMVPPAMATDGALAKSTSGSDGNAGAFWTQLEADTERRMYFTEHSSGLYPHRENIAMLEVNETGGSSSDSAPHNHAVVNPLRSPGYGGSSAIGPEIGKLDLAGGLFGSVPTPASFHNFIQKTISPDIENGVCLKLMTHYLKFPGIVRHFGGGLAGAELDRFYNLNDLKTAVGKYNARLGQPLPAPTGGSAFPAPAQSAANTAADTAAARARSEAVLLAESLKKLDKRAFERAGFSDETINNHLNIFDRLRVRNQPQQAVPPAPAPGGVLPPGPTGKRPINLAVSDAERAEWGTFVTRSSVRSPIEPYIHFQDTPQAQPWEQFLIAFKLLAGGFTRSFACEIEWIDYHNGRPAEGSKLQARVVSAGLAHLIDNLKAAGMFQNTLVVVYTLDGSRSMRANVDGGNPLGRNSVLLAGGAVKGGYFGDIRQIRGGGDPYYAYSMPDPNTGATVASSITDQGEGQRAQGRTSGKVIWRTVAEAMGIAPSDADRFTQLAGAKSLPFVLKT
jgi:Protein of unknown function (DUF1501)